MVIKNVGKIAYDSDDIIGKCPDCTGDVYNVPQYMKALALTEEQINRFEAGECYIGICPDCGKLYVLMASEVSPEYLTRLAELPE
jgi:hypothetical protein